MIFNTADAALLTKMDLGEVVEFDRELAYENIQRVRPGMKVLEVSSKTGLGMDEAASLLEQPIRALRGREPQPA